MDYQKLLEVFNMELLKIGGISISISSITMVALWYCIVIVILRLIKRIIKRLKKRTEHVEEQQAYVMYQLIKYALYTIFIVVSMQTLGLDLSFFLAGSAALMVGVGMGLQNLFNDFISGIFLLFDGTVSVGDIVEVNSGLVGKIQRIDFRTSKLVTIENINIIIPNSKLVSEQVINWTKNKQSSRFEITIGVAYGSDTKKVKSLLIDAANASNRIDNAPAPSVQFEDFGDSALIFKLLIWTTHVFEIGRIRSDIRFAIDDNFRKHNISIPFPQRDIHIIPTKQ